MSAVSAFCRRHRGWIALLLVALIIALLRVPIPTARGVTLAASVVAGPLPLDHATAAWDQASPLAIPLAAQGLWIPNGGGSVPQVTVRALHNGSWLAVYVNWADATKDVSSYRAEDFPDAVAVQIAAGAMTPFVCMGQADSQVQIWQWRANRDVAAGADPSQQAAYPYTLSDDYPFMNDSTFYPAWATGNFLSAYNTTPVQTLVAQGPGSLTSADTHTVYGRGHWEAGQWHVVFLRPLAAPTGEEIGLAVGGDYSVAFAVWDGNHDERNGMKSTSSWVTLALAGAAGPVPVDWGWAAALGVAVAVLFVLTVGLGRRRRRRNEREEERTMREGDR